MKSIRIFVASPGDVTEEREILSNIVIPELRRIFSNQQMFDSQQSIDLEVVRWETHAWPAVGADAQDVINKEIGAYDIFVGVMWKRFGTPTKRAGSGTGEEFDRAYEYFKSYGKPYIMFYFKTSPFYTTNAKELAQFQRVSRFKQKLEKLGLLFWEYGSSIDFERFVREHLIRQIAQIIPAAAAVADSKQGRGKAAATDTESSRRKASPQIFISHARGDVEKVKLISDSLREAGFRPWLDSEQILPGQRWATEIYSAIEKSDFFLIFLSKESLNVNGRAYAENELRILESVLQSKDKAVVIPVRLDDVDPPMPLRGYRWIDYFAKDGPEELIQALRNWEQREQ
ncbi:TIR domain-containing protein [Acidicapsa acidisoli]|uniref:TIR domain-containing protein n=1 Tax=Acidicapsa acidisoli TaxID=1615681 RepID=UPI0021DFC0C0|nr:TIR domain-containing protein [Acidicapsa acidisoli]